MSRPKKPVDPERVKALASIYCTVEEIAYVECVSKDTLERRFMDTINEGRAIGRESLRRQQYAIAMNLEHKGCTTMCIWLGKQTLGQRDLKLDDISDELLAAEIGRRMKEREKNGTKTS